MKRLPFILFLTAFLLIVSYSPIQQNKNVQTFGCGDFTQQVTTPPGSEEQQYCIPASQNPIAASQTPIEIPALYTYDRGFLLGIYFRIYNDKAELLKTEKDRATNEYAQQVIQSAKSFTTDEHCKAYIFGFTRNQQFKDYVSSVTKTTEDGRTICTYSFPEFNSDLPQLTDYSGLPADFANSNYVCPEIMSRLNGVVSPCSSPCECGEYSCRVTIPSAEMGTAFYVYTFEKDDCGNVAVNPLNSGVPFQYSMNAESAEITWMSQCKSRYLSESVCNDGIDNDGNGKTDCEDENCADSEKCKCGNGVIDAGEECDNGMKCCRENGECSDYDCSKDKNLCLALSTPSPTIAVPSEDNFPICRQGGGNGCSEECKTCANEAEDALSIQQLPTASQTCLQIRKFIKTDNTYAPEKMNYKCMPTTTYDSATGEIKCDVVIGYKNYPGAGKFIDAAGKSILTQKESIPDWMDILTTSCIHDSEGTSYPENLKVNYFVRTKKNSYDCFGPKEYLGSTSISPKIENFPEIAQIINPENSYLILAAPMFYQGYALQDQIVSESNFVPFFIDTRLIKGWIYGYGLYWGHFSKTLSNKELPKEASCYVEVYDGNNLIFTSGSMAKPCNEPPEVTIFPTIEFDKEGNAPSYLNIRIDDDSGDPAAVSIPKLSDFAADPSFVPVFKNHEVTKIPVNPKKFKSPYTVEIGVRDNGFGAGGKNCDEPQLTIESKEVKLGYTESSDFPNKKLLPLGTLQFRIKKLDIGGPLLPGTRGASSVVTVERFLDLNSNKMVGRMTTALETITIEPTDSPALKRATRTKVGEAAAESARAYLSESQTLTDSNIAEIETAIKEGMVYEGNTIKSIVQDNIISMVITGKDVNGNTRSPVTVGPFDLTNQETLLSHALPKSEVLDYDVDTLVPKDAIFLTILSASGEPSAGGQWASASGATQYVNQVAELYDKYIYDKTNPNSDAFFNKMDRTLENTKEKLKD